MVATKQPTSGTIVAFVGPGTVGRGTLWHITVTQDLALAIAKPQMHPTSPAKICAGLIDNYCIA